MPYDGLRRLSDEHLLDYARKARDAGQPHPYNHAMEWLVLRHKDRVWAMSFKAPAHLREEMSQEVLLGAIRAALDDREIKNFTAWLNQLVRNRLADFYRSPQYRQLEIDRAATVREDEDGQPLARAEAGVDGGQSAVEAQEIVDGELDRLSDSHRRVVELSIFDDLAAREVARETGESEDNVYQVVKRFRVALRRALEDADNWEAA